MAAQPNLPNVASFGYAVAGAGLIAWGFFGVDHGWAMYALGALGGVLLIEGIIGYCVACAALGLGKKS